MAIRLIKVYLHRCRGLSLPGKIDRYFSRRQQGVEAGFHSDPTAPGPDEQERCEIADGDIEVPSSEAPEHKDCDEAGWVFGNLDAEDPPAWNHSMDDSDA